MFLEKNPRISNIKLERQQACTSAEILTWEQLNCVRMPEDLRNFYLAINGFKCVWSYNFGKIFKSSCLTVFLETVILKSFKN